MSGHGWVTPNADGSKAPCGGPGFCRECSAEAGRPWCADGEHEWVSPGGQGLAEGEQICTKCGQIQRPGPCSQCKQELAGSLIITGIDADKASREEAGVSPLLRAGPRTSGPTYVEPNKRPVDMDTTPLFSTSHADIHGTNWAEHQRVFQIERDAFDPTVARLRFSLPLKDGEITTLLEHLRSWHP